MTDEGRPDTEHIESDVTAGGGAVIASFENREAETFALLSLSLINCSLSLINCSLSLINCSLSLIEPRG